MFHSSDELNSNKAFTFCKHGCNGGLRSAKGTHFTHGYVPTAATRLYSATISAPPQDFMEIE